MNTFWVWMVADACEYASTYWMTCRQCQKLGGRVRKGERSTIAIFYRSYTKEVETAVCGQDTESCRVEPKGREERLGAFFAEIDADLRHHGAQACYEPCLDRVTMPPANLFEAYDHY